MNVPDASVVVLFRNDGPVLTRAMQGLKDQVLEPSFEVVIVDSSDNGEAESLVKSIEGPWQRLSIERSSVGLTPGAARNRGLRASRGRYIAFLAADCVPDPSWLRRRLERHEEGYGAVTGCVTCASPKRLPQLVQWLVRFGGAYPSLRPRTRRVPRFAWSYNRDLLDRGFREDLPASEDRVMNEEVLAKGTAAIFDPRIRLAHVGLTSFRKVLAHQHHHGRAAARLVADPATRALVARYQGRQLTLWYPLARWLRGVPSAVVAGPWTLLLYLLTVPWQLVAHAAWARAFRAAASTHHASPARKNGWIIEEFGRGGIARYAVDVANLLGSDSSVTVATTSEGPAPGLAPRRRADVWFPRGRPGGRQLGAIVGLTRAFSRPSRGDWAWIQIGIRPLYEICLAVALRLRGLHVLCTIHNTRPHQKQRGGRSILLAARICNFSIVHNSHMFRWATHRGLDPMQLPFPTPDITHSGRSGVHTRASLRLDEHDVVVLSFGNVSSYKGLDNLVKALAQVDRENADNAIKLIIAGQQLGERDPSTVAEEMGIESRVRRIAAYLADAEIWDLLSLADAVAFPYLRIDHSGSAALAAAMDIPVLASDLPPLRELFGDRAIYVPPGDVGGLAEALARLPEFVERNRRHRDQPAPATLKPYEALASALSANPKEARI